jgi:hypothetical protein
MQVLIGRLNDDIGTVETSPDGSGLEYSDPDPEHTSELVPVTQQPPHATLIQLGLHERHLRPACAAGVMK